MHWLDLFVFEELEFLAVCRAAWVVQTVPVLLGFFESHAGVQLDFVWDVEQVYSLL